MLLKTFSYQSLPINCDLAESSLIEAALLIGPSFTYELRVAEEAAFGARKLVRDLHAAADRNPFKPWINVVEDDEFYPTEWCIYAVDGENQLWTAVGSPGILK